MVSGPQFGVRAEAQPMSDDDMTEEMAGCCHALATQADFWRKAARVSAIDRQQAQVLERLYLSGRVDQALAIGQQFVGLFTESLVAAKPFLKTAAARVRYHFGIALLLDGRLAEASGQIETAYRQEVFLTEHRLTPEVITTLVTRMLALYPACLWAQYEQARIELAPPGWSLKDVLTERRKEIAFFVQIGAMDGKTFDPIYPFVNGSRWRGLIVEPIREMFKQLQENYKGNRNLAFENAAITETTGEQEMVVIPEDVITSHNLPSIAKGISTLLPDANYMRLFERYAIRETVKCLTLDDLFLKHGVKRVDLLQIDAEGYDVLILDQLDLSRLQPLVINLEIASCTLDQRLACLRRLDRHGYRMSFDGADLCAVRPL